MSYRVEITGWRVGLRKIAVTEELRASAGLSLADAKGATDRVLDGAAVSVSQPSRESAEGLAARLDALGAIASVREQRSDEDDFVEDFGEALTNGELEALLTRARNTSDRDLRLLVKEFLTLRRVAADYLATLDERGSSTVGQPDVYPLSYLRFLLRDEPSRSGH